MTKSIALIIGRMEKINKRGEHVAAKQKEIELSPFEGKIFYKPYDEPEKLGLSAGESYGHAEFFICVKRRKSGDISKLRITRGQQRETDRAYVMHLPRGRTNIHFSGSTDEHIWLVNWCKTCRAEMLELYVPTDRNLNCMTFELFSDSITISFKSERQQQEEGLSNLFG